MLKLKICLFVALFSAIFYQTNTQDFNKEFYANRRQKLRDSIKTGIIVFKNSEEQIRSNDGTYFPYKVNCDFYYLTGYEDPEAAFILLPEGKEKFIMFVKPKNANSAQWFGDVPGIEGAMKIYGADTAYAYSEFERILRGYLFRYEKMYYDFYSKQLQEIIEPLLLKTNGNGPKEIVNISPIVHEMRLIKDEDEIKLIRKAVEITCDAHLEAFKAIKPEMYEYEIAAIFSYIFEKNSSISKGFAPIVASGINATIFHYGGLKRKALCGELVMMDMGAEFMNYSADVTRVVPVSGKYTAEQREVYEINLLMDEALITNMKPENNLKDCIKKAEDIAKEGLFKLGLITDKNTTWQHFLYYFSFIVHPIGLDVHDVGNTNDIKLKPGMVFAVEPLLYIGENLIESFKLMSTRYRGIKESDVDAFLKDTKPVFEKYKGIASRIEDDVLITNTGNEVFSSKLPKTIKEIEKSMAGKRSLIFK